MQPKYDDQDYLQGLPTFADRETCAAIVTAEYFPVTARTIATWPLTVRHPNKKAIHEVAEVLAIAKRKFDEAPAYKQG